MMSASTEPLDPDLHLHAAWLAEVSQPVASPVSQQLSRETGNSTSACSSSLQAVDRNVGQGVRLDAVPRLARRSGLIMNSSVGLMLVLGALVIGSSQRLSVPESWREPPGDGTIGFS